MKVILLTDVPKVGVRHQIKDLKDGFAQNVLIAKGLAIMATPKALADLEKRKLEIHHKVSKELETFDEIINSLKNQKIIIKTKANEKGHLFKSVNQKDVAEAIKNITKIEVAESNIIMEHLKDIGTHPVILRKGKTEGKFEIEIEKS
jgi:large subunit ribosomal protein L9